MTSATLKCAEIAKMAQFLTIDRLREMRTDDASLGDDEDLTALKAKLLEQMLSIAERMKHDIANDGDKGAVHGQQGKARDLEINFASHLLNDDGRSKNFEPRNPTFAHSGSKVFRPPQAAIVASAECQTMLKLSSRSQHSVTNTTGSMNTSGKSLFGPPTLRADCDLPQAYAQYVGSASEHSSNFGGSSHYSVSESPITDDDSVISDITNDMTAEINLADLGPGTEAAAAVSRSEPPVLATCVSPRSDRKEREQLMTILGDLAPKSMRQLMPILKSPSKSPQQGQKWILREAIVENQPRLQSAIVLNHIRASAVTKRSRGKDLRIKFDQVTIRHYERILCDTPPSTGGPGVGIGWTFFGEHAVPVDEYEAKKASGLPRTDLMMSRRERDNLVRSLGYTDKEIVTTIRSVNRTIANRRQTAVNLKAQKMEEVVEGASRTMKRLLSFSRHS